MCVCMHISCDTLSTLSVPQHAHLLGNTFSLYFTLLHSLVADLAFLLNQADQTEQNNSFLMGKSFSGPLDFFCCRTSMGHWETSARRYVTSLLSSYHTSMVGTIIIFVSVTTFFQVKDDGFLLIYLFIYYHYH